MEQSLSFQSKPLRRLQHAMLDANKSLPIDHTFKIEFVARVLSFIGYAHWNISEQGAQAAMEKLMAELPDLYAETTAAPV